MLRSFLSCEYVHARPGASQTPFPATSSRRRGCGRSRLCANGCFAATGHPQPIYVTTTVRGLFAAPLLVQCFQNYLAIYRLSGWATCVMCIAAGGLFSRVLGMATILFHQSPYSSLALVAIGAAALPLLQDAFNKALQIRAAAAQKSKPNTATRLASTPTASPSTSPRRLRSKSFPRTNRAQTAPSEPASS